VENIYIILQQIYSRNGVLNFVGIAQFLPDFIRIAVYGRYYKKKTFWSLFSGHTVISDNFRSFEILVLFSYQL